MAYYYFDSEDHIATVHNADVYLLANVGNYHDFNGEVIQTFKGFYLTADKTFTIGGNYGNNWNIYQKQSLRANKSNQIFAAVSFNGNGELNLSSQIGAPDGKKHDDRNIKINAYNFLSNDLQGKNNISEWEHYKASDGALDSSFTINGKSIELTLGSEVNENKDYNTSGQIADINGIYAKNTLTVASHFNGYINVEGYHESIGMKVGTGVTNTANDTSTIAAGLRGNDAVNFNGSFFGSIKANVQVHFQTAAALTMQNNTIGAYGVFSQESITQNNIHAGTIFATANNSYLDATIKNSSNGNLSNNTITAAGLRAKDITINQLDASFNSSHASTTKIEYIDENAVFEYSNLETNIGTAKDLTQKIDAAVVYDTTGAGRYYYIELPSSVTAEYGANVEFTNGSYTGRGTKTKIVNYVKNSEGKYSKQEKDVVLINPNDSLSMSAFWAFKDYNDGYMTEDITTWRMGGILFTTNDVNNIAAGKVSFTNDITEEMTETDNLCFSAVGWQCEKVFASGDGCYILNIDGEYVRIEASDVTFNGKYCSYTFTEEDAELYDTVNLTSLGFDNNKIQGYYEFDYTSNSITFNQSNSYNSGSFAFVAADSSVNDFQINYSVTGEEDSKNGTLSTNDLNNILSETNRENIKTNDNTLPKLVLYEYKTNQNEQFNINITVDENTLIHSEANGNILKVTGYLTPASNTMQNNIVQAIGIYGEDTLNIKDFAAGSVIETFANNNELWANIAAGTVGDNQINSIGIYGNTVNLNDFYGTINVEAHDNYIYKPAPGGHLEYFTITGVRATNLNVDRNLHGIINVNATNNYTGVISIANWTDRNDQYGSHADYYFQPQHIDGIYADNMSVDGFIKSTITINAVGPDFASGVYVSGTLDTKGFSGDITVNSMVSNAFGIYAKTLKSDLGYYYTFMGEDAGNDYGTNPGEKKIVVALDTFTVEGSIFLQGVSQHHGIATRDAANIYLDGFVMTTAYTGMITDFSLDNLYYMSQDTNNIDLSYAVKTDFANDVASGFKNDILQLGENATVFGIIALGGGNNDLTFDDNARFFGYVYHDTGKINLTYALNDEQARYAGDEYAIHTINNECDATLSSNTTITINCNNIAEGEVYRILEYVGDSDVTDLADAHWKTGALTISYMGESRLIYLNNYSGLGQIDGSNGESIYVKVNYDTDTHTLSVKALKDANAKEDPFFTPQTLTAVNIETRIEDMLDGNGEVVKDANGNAVKVENEYVSLNTVNSLKTQEELTAMQIAFEHHISWRNDSEVDYVTYSKDETTYSSTASTTLYWMCDIADYKNSAYEIVYEIVDAQGRSYSHALLRLNTVDGNKDAFNGTIEIDGNKKNPVTGRIYLVNADGKTFAEYQKEGYDPSTFVGAYYIMSYDIDNLPEGSTVNYQIRDYYGDGFEISEWVNASINTQKQEYPAFVNDVNSKYMVAVNPDDNTRRIGSSIALFTWRAVESNYAVDHYNVQYFSSTEDLSGNDLKRKAIFDAYAKASKQNGWQNGVHSYVENGKTITFDIYFGNGEIQIRELVNSIKFSDGTEENIYNYYNFVSKNVSGTELLASGLSNQSYIYWQVNATDVLGTKNNYVEGGDFRIFLGDTEGPAFIDTTKLEYNKELGYAIASKEFTIKDFTWGGVTADDEKSGVRYYIVEASPKDKNQWTEVYHIDAHELDDIQKFNFDIAPGIYDIRVRPVDAAGNYGTPSDKITIYAVDNEKPECTLTETKANAWTIGEGEYMQQLGWNYTFSFDPAVDPTSQDGTFQSTGINEYVIEVYYTDFNGAKNSVDWELWGLTNDPETGDLTYVRINGVNPKNNKFVPDGKYKGYQVRTDNMTYYELDSAGKPVYDEELEGYRYNNRNYFVSISVSDKIGNTTSIINKELNVSPEGGGDDGGSTGGSAPVGVFTDIKEAVVKATHEIKEVAKPGEDSDSSSDSEGENDDNTNSKDETVQVIGKITDATVTLSWTDTFESPNGVYYLMQVSDSAFFNTDETYTVLIMSSSVPNAEAWDIYYKLAGKYQNLRLYSVHESGSSSSGSTENNNNENTTTTTAGEKWRNGSGIYTTTVIFDNLQPTAAVGMFSKPGQTFWQIKAVDKFGNETDFEAVQNLNFVSDVTKEQIVENGTNTQPAQLEVKAEQNIVGYTVNNSKLYQNNGDQNLSFYVDNTSTLLGYEHFTAEYYNHLTGESGSYGIYALHSENHGGSAITQAFNCYLHNQYGEKLSDGDYTLTVKAYDFNGNFTVSEAYTFTQDTVRPVIPSTQVGSGINKVNTTIKVAFDKPTDGDPRVLTTVSWPLALDLYGIKGYVLSYRCKAINNEWQKVYVNGTDILTENSCKITLFNDQVYDFAIYAIDNNGNCSEERVVENVIISYKDIDDPDFLDFNPGYTPYGTGPITINNQLIGGGDTIDTIRVGTNNGTKNAGEMQITISNLQLINGYGPYIVLDVYEEYGGNILKNTYYFDIYSANSATGVTVKYLLNESGNKYHFEIRSLDGSTLQYDLHYQFDWFKEEHSNDNAFALNYARNDAEHTVKFDDVMNEATYAYFVGDDQFSNRVGYGDPNNYTRLVIGTDGKYTFKLTKEGKNPDIPENITQYCQDTLSTVSVTIYKATSGWTSLTYVSGFTVAYYEFENALKDLVLTEGEYVIQVNSASAAYGANIKYNLEISTAADKYFAEKDFADNEPDKYSYVDYNKNGIFTTADSVKEYPFKDKEGNEGEYYMAFGKLTESNTSVAADYVGIGDAVDFTKIEVDEAGRYTFNFAKADAGTDNHLLMTIYQKVEGTTYLSALNSTVIYAGTYENTLSQYLDKGEYYLSVSAYYPDYTAVYYAVGMIKEDFGAEGNFNIADDDRFDINIVDKNTYTANNITFTEPTGLIYLNDAYVENKQKIIVKTEELSAAQVELDKANAAVAAINAEILYYETILADPEGIFSEEERAEYEDALATAEDEKNILVKAQKAAQSIVDGIHADISAAEEAIKNAGTSYEYLGFGEARNYFYLTINHNGDYTFTLNRDLETRGAEYSNLYATIYKANADGNGFYAVSGLMLYNTVASSVLTLTDLAAGEYYIEVSALEAAYGYTAKYNISIDTLAAKGEKVEFVRKNTFIKAMEYTIGDTVKLEPKPYEQHTHDDNCIKSGDDIYSSHDDDLYRYYKFTTNNTAGLFEFEFDFTDTTVSYNLYYEAEGSVNLVYVPLTRTYDTENQKYVYSAYLDADKQYYLSASSYSYTPNEHKSYGFTIYEDAKLAQDLTAYTSDNDFAHLADDQVLNIGTNATTAEYDRTASFDSWVGYGDVNSWRKLTLEDGGNFKLTMDNQETKSDSYVTVTVYKMAASGTALTAVGSYAAYFSAGTETVADFGYLLLEKGDYYLHVQNHSYYGNTEFTLTVDGVNDANNANDDTCFIAKVDKDNTGKVYNDNTAFTDREITVGGPVSGWVGYTDEYDYFNLTVANSGYYDFKFSNTDWAQVTLYVVNPDNSTLTYVNSCYRYSADNNFAFTNQLLENDSQYVVMVQSTNSYYGGNSDYTLSISTNPNNPVVSDEFRIEQGQEGWYTFKCNGNLQTPTNFSILQYYDTLGQAYAVGMYATANKSEYLAYLSAGDYLIKSELGSNVKDGDNIDTINKIITLNNN